MRFPCFTLAFGLLVWALPLHSQKNIKINESIFYGELYQADKLPYKQALSGAVKFERLPQNEDKLPLADWLSYRGANFQAKSFSSDPLNDVFNDAEMDEKWHKDFRTYKEGKNIHYLSLAIEQEFEVLLIYGNAPNQMHVVKESKHLLVLDKRSGKISKTVDLSSLGLPPDFMQRDREHVYQSIRWAKLENNILYITQTHAGNPNFTQGMDAYLTAIDLDKKKILWRSQPLISNAVNFVCLDRVILTAYNTTRKAGRVYATDKASGQLVGEFEFMETGSDSQRNPLYLVYKNGLLHIKLGNKTDIGLSVKGAQ